MILLKAQISIQPEYHAEFIEQMQRLIATSLQETGCLSFGCYADIGAASSFVVLETWQSHEDLARHEASAHLADFKARIGSMIVSRQPTKVYSVLEVGGL